MEIVWETPLHGQARSMFVVFALPAQDAVFSKGPCVFPKQLLYPGSYGRATSACKREFTLACYLSRPRPSIHRNIRIS